MSKQHKSRHVHRNLDTAQRHKWKKPDSTCLVIQPHKGLHESYQDSGDLCRNQVWVWKGHEEHRGVPVKISTCTWEKGLASRCIQENTHWAAHLQFVYHEYCMDICSTTIKKSSQQGLNGLKGSLSGMPHLTTNSPFCVKGFVTSCRLHTTLLW